MEEILNDLGDAQRRGLPPRSAVILKPPGYTTWIHLFLGVRRCSTLFHSVPLFVGILVRRHLDGTPANTLKHSETPDGKLQNSYPRVRFSHPPPISSRTGGRCQSSAQWTVTRKMRYMGGRM